jgi:hypothetical protein
VYVFFIGSEAQFFRQNGFIIDKNQPSFTLSNGLFFAAATIFCLAAFYSRLPVTPKAPLKHLE